MTDKAKERNGRTSERTKVRREIIGGFTGHSGTSHRFLQLYL